MCVCVYVLVCVCEGFLTDSGKVKVEVDGSGMSDVQDTIWLWWEPGHYLTPVRRERGGGEGEKNVC